MKYIVINRLAPGIDNARKALEVFTKVGLPEGSEAVWHRIGDFVTDQTNRMRSGA